MKKTKVIRTESYRSLIKWDSPGTSITSLRPEKKWNTWLQSGVLDLKECVTSVPLLCFRENNTEVWRDSATYPGLTVNNGKARPITLISWKAFH